MALHLTSALARCHPVVARPLFLHPFRDDVAAQEQLTPTTVPGFQPICAVPLQLASVLAGCSLSAPLTSAFGLRDEGASTRSFFPLDLCFTTMRRIRSQLTLDNALHLAPHWLVRRILSPPVLICHPSRAFVLPRRRNMLPSCPHSLHYVIRGVLQSKFVKTLLAHLDH